MAIELAANGEVILPRLFETLVTRQVASETGEPQPLSLEGERVILRALEFMDPDDVMAYLEHELGTRSLARRRAVVLFLGAAGRATETLKLFLVALSYDEKELDPSMARATSLAITAILKRDPVAFGVLEASLPALRKEILPAAVEALGASGDRRGFGFLCLTARDHEDLRPLVIEQIPAVGMGLTDALNIEMRGYVRDLIRRERPACQAAIRAAATLRDDDSIPALIELVTEEEDDLEAAAVAALRAMTGWSFETKTGWVRWYEAERAWMASERAAAFQMLSSADHREVAKALNAIAPHPLVREEFVAVLSDLLRTRSVQIRLLVCHAIKEGGVREAIPELLAALTNDSNAVGVAAHHALQVLTGRDLPLEPAVWEGVAREMGYAKAN